MKFLTVCSHMVTCTYSVDVVALAHDSTSVFKVCSKDHRSSHEVHIEGLSFSAVATHVIVYRILRYHIHDKL